MMDPAGVGGVRCELGGHSGKHSPPKHSLQDTLNAATRHRWPPEALGSILASRLSRSHCLLLASGALHSLERAELGRLLEAAHIDFHSDDASEREAERQRRAWAQWCATSPPRRARR